MKMTFIIVDTITDGELRLVEDLDEEDVQPLLEAKKQGAEAVDAWASNYLKDRILVEVSML